MLRAGDLERIMNEAKICETSPPDMHAWRLSPTNFGFTKKIRGSPSSYIEFTAAI